MVTPVEEATGRQTSNSSGPLINGLCLSLSKLVSSQLGSFSGLSVPVTMPAKSEVLSEMLPLGNMHGK